MTLFLRLSHTRCKKKRLLISDSLDFRFFSTSSVQQWKSKGTNLPFLFNIEDENSKRKKVNHYKQHISQKKLYP